MDTAAWEDDYGLVPGTGAQDFAEWAEQTLTHLMHAQMEKLGYNVCVTTRAK
ncbi:hypothetical protein [Mycolicibacterium sphagni]|uniref:hypothetical protein n=1 Tax=Mycolicibacterium sphagni TaxID=1786 RepID=UPI0021F29DF4|nr:hypothetical protein [Mycolicibacterium sphagni]MCV7174843.1 hypothetical protein [Mycolicibacterium sphagni]